MTDPRMREIRADVNAIIEACAEAAERGGPAAVRALKVVESDQVPAKPVKDTRHAQ